MSLRARLLAGMAVIAAVLAIVSLIITTTTRDELIGQLDDRLMSFARGPELERGLVPPPLDGFPDQTSRPVDGFERLSDVYQGFVVDGALMTLFMPSIGDEADVSEPDVDVDDLPAQGIALFSTDAVEGDLTYRVLARPFGGGTAITALPLNDVEDTISRLVLVVIAGTATILAVLGLVTWWVLRLGIRPVKQMTESASQIAGGDLTVRVPESSPGTEAGQLALALNRMLGRIEDALGERARSEQRLRRFVSDAAHELRTPVTTIRGYAELYRHGGVSTPAQLDDAMLRTENEASRIGRLVDDMLLLAKLDEERPLDHRPVDLGVLVTDAANDARIAAPGRPITVDYESVVIDGDEDRLRQVVANVVGNALVHTDAGLPVHISARRDGDQAVLVVEDQGPGMPVEVAERATERFYRADQARSRHRGGSGLGLSIVDATVTSHGGEVSIDTATGGGTRVRITLPVMT